MLLINNSNNIINRIDKKLSKSTMLFKINIITNNNNNIIILINTMPETKE